jgi:hypothetical protein
MAPARRKKATKAELLADRSAVWPEDGLCPLCGRAMVRGATLNEHHLIPRMYGGTRKYFIRRVCHSKIHSLFSEAELAYLHNTFAKLRAQPEIRSFVKWIGRQDPQFMTRHRRPRRDV